MRPVTVKRERLDKLLVDRGAVSSRERARRLVMAGAVRIADRVVDKPGALVAVDAPHFAQWDGLGPAHSRARIGYVLRSTDDGHTVFGYTNEFHPPGGRLGNAAGRLIVGATSEREAHDSLARLKALLENLRAGT